MKATCYITVLAMVFGIALSFGCVKTTEKPANTKTPTPTVETTSESGEEADGLELSTAALPMEVVCVEVIDGETFQTTTGEQVRLLGVDTSGNTDAAKKFLKTLITAETIRLVYDVIARDELHRLLAYGYLRNGVFINAEMIRRGYAVVHAKYPLRYLDEFHRYETLAREARVGRWAPIERPAERVREKTPRIRR